MKFFMVKHKACPIALCAVLVMFCISQVRAQAQPHFATPEEAVAALIATLQENDNAALAALLGPGSEDVISSGDDVADTNARKEFLADYQTAHVLVQEDENTMVLEVGETGWPLPIPIVSADGKWYLDGAAGAEEIVYRRIGRNELGAIAVCRGFIDAQLEYSAVGHDGNDAGIFAAKLRSDPGLQNGLYWPTTEGDLQSPIGEAVARAAAEGYRAVAGKRTPYHGYYYRMLYAQGPDADGGAAEYFVDGALTEGIALLAWPADYGVSGVMSFMVNNDGVVYQKDLGEHTESEVENIQLYNPDTSWSVVVPEGDS